MSFEEVVIEPKFDYGYVFAKVGDKVSFKGIKDGMIADIRNPNIHDCNFSDHEKKVFCIYKVPLAKIEELEAFDFETVKDFEGFKSRGYIDFAELEEQTGIKGLESDLRSEKVVDIIDCTKLQDIQKDIKTYTISADIKKDLNATTEGNVSYGSGGVFSTKALLYADIGDLTNDLYIYAVSDTIETTSSIITENLNGFTFTDDEKGFKTITTANINVSNIQAIGSGNVVLKNMDIAAVNNASYNGLITAGQPGTAYNLTLNKIKTNCATYQRNNIVINGSGLVVNADSIITIGGNRGFAIFDCDSSSKVENVLSAYSIGLVNNTGLSFNSKALHVKNCIGIGNGADFDGTGSLSTFSKCSSEDATGSEVDLQCITFDVEFEIGAIANVQEGLINWYKLNGNATDSMGNQDGTNYGATSVTGYLGGSNNAMTFSGTDYIDLIDIPTISSASAFSFSLWLNTTDTTGAPFYAYKTDTTHEVAIDIGGYAANYLSFRVEDGNMSYLKVPYTNYWGRWVHIACVYDGSLSIANRFKIYLDGADKSSSGLVVGTPPTSSPDLTGGDFTMNLSSFVLDCSIADFRIYNKALSEGEVLALSSLDRLFKVKRIGGVCADGGTSPSIASNTEGFYGNPRPHCSNLYSIGASELALPIAVFNNPFNKVFNHELN